MTLRKMLATALALFAALYVIAHMLACFPEIPQVAAAAGYEAQQMRCVDQYAHRADIDRCRARVAAAWSTTDAGTDAEAGK